MALLLSFILHTFPFPFLLLRFWFLVLIDFNIIISKRFYFILEDFHHLSGPRIEFYLERKNKCFTEWFTGSLADVVSVL